MSSFMILICLSVTGAFRESIWSQALFNSPPLATFWMSLLCLFMAAFIVSRNLRRKPGLFLMHLDCILIVAGSMWDSESGHTWQNRIRETAKVPGGFMPIHEGHSERHIVSKDLHIRVGTSPFTLRLNDFRMEYYWHEGTLLVRAPSGRVHSMPARHGALMTRGEGIGTLSIKQRYKNLKVRSSRSGGTIIDQPGTDRDPALAVVKGGTVVGQKVIQVNDPLHFGGYYFYQASYDRDYGRYSILSVTSDSGYTTVFSGYALLCLGAFWAFWFRPVMSYIEKRKNHGNQIQS